MPDFLVLWDLLFVTPWLSIMETSLQPLTLCVIWASLGLEGKGSQQLAPGPRRFKKKLSSRSDLSALNKRHTCPVGISQVPEGQTPG